MQSDYRLGVLLFCGGALLGCASRGPSRAGPLIPREVLFGNPDKAAGQLSPDASHLAFLAPVDGVLNIWVGPVDRPHAATPITRDTGRGIRQYFWAYDSRHLLYLQDTGGDENWRVYCVPAAGGAARDLTPLEGVQARIEAVSRKFPAEIIVSLNDRDPELHDIYRVNILTGERRLVLQNEGFANLVLDDDYAVRLGQKVTPDGGSELFARTADGEWRPFARIGADDSLTTAPVGFDKTNTVLYLLDSRERDTGALTTVHLVTGKQTVVAEHPRADVDDVLLHPTERNIQAVAFSIERKEWRILDPSIEADFAYLKTVAPGDFEITSRSLDDRHWLVVYLQDDGPARYYHYDRNAREARFLFTNRKALEAHRLAKMHPVTIKSRDGLDLVSYLTLPPESDPDHNARPAEPLPMVLLVHGGPWARDEWGYDPYHQWLANRGYAVLSVNFRGSTGFGKRFLNAGDKEWGGKMHDDLIDAANWAVAEKVADPGKIAIMGGSYGGYAALVGLTFTPEVFACGVDIVGPSNLVTLIESIPPYWKPMLDLFTARVGDPRTPEGHRFLLERSPIQYVDRIRRPLLIGHGANDPRVKQAEADQIVSAMRQRNIPVTYVLFPDEGHGFARPPNNMAFNAITEAFLARHLGGRFEPVGDDFTDSSVQVKTGAEDVPGLIEALGAIQTN